MSATLLDGRIVERISGKTRIPLETECPAKIIVIDMEMGSAWQWIKSKTTPNFYDATPVNAPLELILELVKCARTD